MNILGPMQDYNSFRPSKKRSSSSSTINRSFCSDQFPREVESRSYTSDYEMRLRNKGSYMREYDNPSDVDNMEKKEKIREDCKSLLERCQTHPDDTLFGDKSFQRTCEKIRNRNKAVVVQDISRLIIPLAINLAILGASQLNNLFETVKQGWNSIEPFEGSRPQPDYAVGFNVSAFTQRQLDNLRPYIGLPGSEIVGRFLATPDKYFPFLTCEVKCGSDALDITDRQNAHSMTVAVKAIIILFQAVNR